MICLYILGLDLVSGLREEWEGESGLPRGRRRGEERRGDAKEGGGQHHEKKMDLTLRSNTPV